MTTFYFNDALPEKINDDIDIQLMFETLIRNFSRLRRREELEIENYIISHNPPAETKIASTTLADLIKGCGDKDVKRLALILFQKYPDSVFYEIEDVYKTAEEIDIGYSLDNVEASHLRVPAMKGWLLLSIPLNEVLSETVVTLNGTDGEYLSLANFHGRNFNKIAMRIIDSHCGDNQEAIEALSGEEKVSRRLKLLQNSLEHHNVFLSEEFKDSFRELAVVDQESLMGMVSDYWNADILMPVRADDNRIKKCKGKGNEHLYEMRKDTGVRLYFTEHEPESIIFALTHTKAQVSGDKDRQSAIINRASAIANREVDKIIRGVLCR